MQNLHFWKPQFLTSDAPWFNIPQSIQPERMGRRIEFCEWAVPMLQDDRSFLPNSFFSDKPCWKGLCTLRRWCLAGNVVRWLNRPVYLRQNEGWHILKGIRVPSNLQNIWWKYAIQPESTQTCVLQGAFQNWSFSEMYWLPLWDKRGSRTLPCSPLRRQ